MYKIKSKEELINYTKAMLIEEIQILNREYGIATRGYMHYFDFINKARKKCPEFDQYVDSLYEK